MHKGRVSPQWRVSRYEDVPQLTRLNFRSDLLAIAQKFPRKVIQGLSCYVIGSYGIGTAFWGSDLDLVISPTDDAKADYYRQLWHGSAKLAYPQILADLDALSDRHGIGISLTFGLKPIVGYNLNTQTVIGRPDGVSLNVKCKFDFVTQRYVLTPLPLTPVVRGAYNDTGRVLMGRQIGALNGNA